MRQRLLIAARLKSLRAEIISAMIDKPQGFYQKLSMPDRIPGIEATLASLQRQVDEVKVNMKRLEDESDKRHGENTEKLGSLEIGQAKILQAIQFGGTIMHIIWGLGGTIVGGFIVKMFAHKLLE